MKYRKKPVIIEAVQWDGINFDEVCNFCPAIMGETYKADGNLKIPTLEGEMIASPQDYIIKGIKGEFYPCKPDIFNITYEPVI